MLKISIIQYGESYGAQLWQGELPWLPRVGEFISIDSRYKVISVTHVINTEYDYLEQVEVVVERAIG